MSNKDQKVSKKAKQEKQKKAIEDVTFGLKNKNKSKKVQQFINRVEKSVKHSGDGLERERAKELKKEAKLAKQLQEEQMRLLFQEAIGNQYGVKKTKAAANAAALGLNSQNQSVAEFLGKLSDDDSSDSDDSSDDDFDANLSNTEIDEEPVNGVEVFREKTIEDIIEEQRAKLSLEGKKGTPVTEETFMKWRADKLAKKQADAEARVKAEQTKKKGGKGLSVLSGKELFSFNASLFVDDESAFDTTNDSALDAEMKELQRKEEEQLAAETRKAQEEQERLMAAQQLEIDARKYKENQRRDAAQAADRVLLTFNGISINKVVFEDDEDEDLTFFVDEEPFVKMDALQFYNECDGDLSKIFARLSVSGGSQDGNDGEDGDDNDEDDEEEGNDEGREEDGDDDDGSEDLNGDESNQTEDVDS